MILRYATIMFAAAVLATVAALSVSALEPKTSEAANTVRTCGSGSMAPEGKEKRTLQLINRERKSHGLEKLCVHPQLQRAARAHSKDMIQRDYFAHGNIGARLRSYGYHGNTYSENIGEGFGARGRPRAVFRRWMTSSAHKSNILDNRFREVGVGVATGNYKGIRGYNIYTVDFGRRR
jgi:uncharacterized protein YkwD